MATQPLWIETIPVISTAHTPHERAITELSSADFILSAEYAQGAFIYLPDVADCVDAVAWLQPIVEWALPQHFNWIRLDADGDIVPALPEFNW